MQSFEILKIEEAKIIGLSRENKKILFNLTDIDNIDFTITNTVYKMKNSIDINFSAGNCDVIIMERFKKTEKEFKILYDSGL